MIAKTMCRGDGTGTWARSIGTIAVAAASLLSTDGFGQQDSPALAEPTPRTVEEEDAVRELTRTRALWRSGLGTSAAVRTSSANTRV